MKCLICDKDFKNGISLGAHIRKFHKLTSKEYYDKYIRKESEGYCEVCGKETSFRGFKGGYLRFCSLKCQGKSEKLKEEKKARFIEKHKVSHHMKLEEVKNKVKNTMLERYGVESYLATDLVKEQTKKDSLEKWGNEIRDRSKKYQEYKKNKYLEKHKVNHPMKIKEIAEKAKNKRLKWVEDMSKNNFTPVIRLIEKYGQGWYYKIDYPFTIHKGMKFVPNSFIKTIKEYSESSIKSHFEDEVYKEICKIYSGKIVKNSRKVINENGTIRELDIYLPEVNFAIECNGIYYHSEESGTRKNYHKIKTELCLEKDISLIHINEEEWLSNKKECLNLIQSYINTNKSNLKEVNSNKITLNLYNQYSLKDILEYAKEKEELFVNIDLSKYPKIHKDLLKNNFSIEKEINPQPEFFDLKNSRLTSKLKNSRTYYNCGSIILKYTQKERENI